MLLNGVFKIKSIRQWADEAREKKTPEKFESQARKRCPSDGSELGYLTLAGIVFVFFSACARQVTVRTPSLKMTSLFSASTLRGICSDLRKGP